MCKLRIVRLLYRVDCIDPKTGAEMSCLCQDRKDAENLQRDADSFGYATTLTEEEYPA